MVGTEALVLESQQHRYITRIDIGYRRWHAPAPILHGEGAQQLPVAIKHDGGALGCLGEIEQRKAEPGDGEQEDGGEEDGQRCKEEQTQASFLPLWGKVN